MAGRYDDVTERCTGLEATVAAAVRPRQRVHTATLEVGTRLGHYLVGGVHQRGGFASVHRATHEPTGVQVALKVLHPDLAISDNMVRRFEREAAILDEIRHPNIVRVHEVGTLPDGRPFFAMEWLEGHTLAEELATRGPLSVGEVVPLIEDLCAALSAAHAAGVVHRDLKASNVMLVPAGQWFVVKLLDFGIVKLLDPDEAGGAGLTSTGNRLGTPHNMAPEQVCAGAVDERTDVYSMGVLLYQLLTGRFPYDGENAVEIWDMHLHAPAPAPSDVAAISSQVDRVVLRCLEKRPEDRYGSVAELARDLAAAARSDGSALPHWCSELRPSLRVRSREVPAVGVHVEMLVDCADDEDLDDDSFDAVEDCLAEARAELELAGMEIAEEAGCSLLGIAQLSDASDDAAQQRLRAIEAALTVAYALESSRARASVRVRVSVHAASVVTLVLDGRQDYVGGALLRVAEWATGGQADRVLATDAALRDIGSRLLTEEVSGVSARAVIAVLH